MEIVMMIVFGAIVAAVCAMPLLTVLTYTLLRRRKLARPVVFAVIGLVACYAAVRYGGIPVFYLLCQWMVPGGMFAVPQMMLAYLVMTVACVLVLCLLEWSLPYGVLVYGGVMAALYAVAMSMGLHL